MEALERIVEEIEHEALTNKEIGRKQCEGMARSINIIRRHMSEGDTRIKKEMGHIPVLERIIEEIEERGNVQFSSYTKPLIVVEDVVKIIRKYMDDNEGLD